MYLWVPLPSGIASATYARRALEEFGVVTLPGSGFGPAGEGFFRIALTVGAGRLTQAAERLGRALEATRRGALAATA
jgi:LL-diaminopimelate aminotransferase